MTRQVVEGGINWSEAYGQLKERHGSVILDPFLFIRGYKAISAHEGGSPVCHVTELVIPHALGRRFGRRNVQLRNIVTLRSASGNTQTDVLEARFDPQQNGIVISAGRKVENGRTILTEGRYVYPVPLRTSDEEYTPLAEGVLLPGDKDPRFPDMPDFPFEKQYVDSRATVAAMLKPAREGGRPFQRIRYERPSSLSRPRKSTPKAS